MNVTHQPYPDTIETAECFVGVLTQVPANEFIFFDPTARAVIELADKEPGSVEFREPPYFLYSLLAEDLVTRLAQWLESLPRRIAPYGRGYLFGGIVPGEVGGQFVSIAPVDLI